MSWVQKDRVINPPVYYSCGVIQSLVAVHGVDRSTRLVSHSVIGTVLLFCCSLSGGSGMSPSCVASHIFFLRIDLILPVLKPFFCFFTHIIRNSSDLGKAGIFSVWPCFFLYRWEYTATFLRNTYTDSVYFYWHMLARGPAYNETLQQLTVRLSFRTQLVITTMDVIVNKTV